MARSECLPVARKCLGEGSHEADLIANSDIGHHNFVIEQVAVAVGKRRRSTSLSSFIRKDGWLPPSVNDLRPNMERTVRFQTVHKHKSVQGAAPAPL